MSSNKVVELHAIITQMELKSVNPLTQWCKGLQIILQQISIDIKMESYRAIFLIEADFNFGNKLYFGSRMIKQAT